MTAGTTSNDTLATPGGSLAVARATTILLLTAGCVVFVLTGWVSPVRVVFAIAFLLFVPGLALAELLDVRDLAQRIAIATSASLALETLLAIGLIYAGAFSLRLSIGIITAWTGVLLGLALIRDLRSKAQRAA